jgi:hypothetical protein
MKNYIFLPCFFVSIFFLKDGFAQNIQLKEEHTELPISFASVFVKQSNKYFLTDSFGLLSLGKANHQTIYINALGYQNKSIELNKDTIIYLKKTLNLLPEVYVKSNRKTIKTKVYKSRNAIASFFGYGYSNFLKFTKEHADLVEFKDSIVILKNLSFDAKIYGNQNNQFVRLRLYQIKETANFNQNDYDGFLNQNEEIYEYDLKDVYPENSRKLSFKFPDGIVLNKGYYLFALQISPSQNRSQKLIINFTSDKYLHSFNRNNSSFYKNNQKWNHDWYKQDKYLNMQIKIEYTN